MLHKPIASAVGQTLHKMPPENKYQSDYSLNTTQVRKDCGNFPSAYPEK